MRNQDLFRYYQLRDYYNKKRKVKVNDIHPLTKMMMAPYEHTLPRIISYLYEVLMCSGRPLLYNIYKIEMGKGTKD